MSSTASKHGSAKDPSKLRKKPSRKLRIPSTRNPYGKIVEDAENWPPRNDMLKALSLGPTAIRDWQKGQIDELIVPHLSGQQIESIIGVCGFSPSLLFAKIHQALISEFLNSTLSSVNSESEQNKKKLIAILRSSLRFIRIPHFTELNVSILSRIDVLPKHILRILSEPKNQDLMAQFPTNIKRQIWSSKLSLFDREFEALYSAYCDPSYFWALDNFENIVKRANNETLKAMVDDIGSSAILFTRCTSLLAKRFKKCVDCERERINWRELVFLSHFRVDLAASLYDHAHRHLLEECDPIWPAIYGFYYAEQAKQTLTTAQIESLQKNLVSSQCHIETAMFCSIPWIKSLLFETFFALLAEIGSKRILPRDSKPLSLLCLILQATISPNSQCPKPQSVKVDHRVFFQFVPLLTVCVFVDSLSPALAELNAVSDDLAKYANESALCSHLLIYYVLHCLGKKRVERAVQVMQAAMQSEHGLDSYWLAMSGLTEIHMLCKRIQSVEGVTDAKQKQTMIEFAIAFIAHCKGELVYRELAQPVMALVESLKIGKKECALFIRRLR